MKSYLIDHGWQKLDVVPYIAVPDKLSFAGCQYLPGGTWRTCRYEDRSMPIISGKVLHVSYL